MVEEALQAVLASAGVGYYHVEDGLRPDTDIVCVIGGDGTLFTYAHFALDKDVPIWFINAGSVGFLAESSVDLPERVGRLKAGDYTCLTRDLLAVEVGERTYTALNDVCLMRDTQHLQTVTLEVSCADETVAAYRGDGALVCTAMGSTGYALSAGAPIMSPNAKGMLFAPICAHSLLAKPVLFGAEDKVYLRCTESAVLFVDGVNCGTVEGIPVEVTVSARTVKFVCTERRAFFAKIGSKLL